MKNKFKKLMSVMASTALVTSTIGLGFAANYPSPFVKNGQADVAVVWGSGNSAPTDLVAVADITANLQARLAEQTATGGSSSSGSGSSDEFVRLDKSSDKLNLGNAINGPFGSTVDDSDITVLLADGQYSADDNDDFDYEQKITLGSTTLSHFRDSDYEALVGLDERTPTLGFRMTSGTFVLNYTLDFLDDAESDVDSNNDLEDIEGSDIPLMGRTYYVSDAKNGTVATNTGKLTLLDSANTAIVREGETVTVTVEDTSYDVSIDFVDSDSTALVVNGQTTDDLAEGATEKLDDGSYVGIRDVRKLEVSGEVGTVEFSIGVGKLELEHGADIKLNDDSISGVKSYLEKGTRSAKVEKLDKIVIEWKTDDEEYISSETDLSMPGFGALEFSMNDFVRPTEEKVTVQNDGDTSVEIEVPIRDGDASINLLFANSTGDFTGIGRAADERLATSHNGSLKFFEKRGGNDYHVEFVATYNSSDEGESYLLDMNIQEDSGDNRNETTIKNVVTGETWDERTAGDTFDLGDVSFTINSLGKNATDEWAVITAGSQVNFNTVYTTGGLRVYLPFDVGDNATIQQPAGSKNLANLGAINLSAANGSGAIHTDTFLVHFDGEDKDDTLAAGVQFNVTIDDNTDNNLHVNQVNQAGTGGATGLEVGDSTDTYEAYIVDDVAPRVLHYTNPDEDWAEIFYPMGDSESYAEVFLGSSGVDTSTAETTVTGGSVANLGSVAVSDSEASSVASKNLIVVGGSCVNSVAADLLGGGFCGGDFEDSTGVGSGSFLIETFAQSGGKVATLVAGYNSGDTTNAAKYLTTQTVDTGVGSKYVGSTATSATLVTE